MFRCEMCGTCSKPGEQQRSVVTEQQLVTYPERHQKVKKKKGTAKWIIHPPSQGLQTVKEVFVLPDCSPENCGNKCPLKAVPVEVTTTE